MTPILKKILPEPSAVIREAIIVFAGLLIAAYVINRIPKLQKFIQDASITIKNEKGVVIN